MTIVGIGNLVLDYYLVNNKIYVNGGDTISNILSNLSVMGQKTKIIGYYGNDILGMIAKQSLEECGVETDLLEVKKGHTKCFFINEGKTSSICPYCRSKYKNFPLKKDIKNLIQPEDIILIKDYTILPKITNKVCLDLGHLGPLKYEKKEKIEKFLFQTYYMVNIKEDVLIFLLKKLKISFQEFQRKNNIWMLIITKDKRGASILFKNKEYIIIQK